MYYSMTGSVYSKEFVSDCTNKRPVYQRWANLDQASKHLEVFRFRDLSPTPKP